MVGKNIEVRERKEYNARHLNARYFLPRNYKIITTGTRKYVDADRMKWTQWTIKIKNLSNS